MRHNSASKAQAIALVKKAKAAGFKREVHALSICGRVYAVQVSLSGAVHVGGIYDWVNINVSFRRSTGRRQSVAISSITRYARKSRPGLWHAGYVVNELIRQVEGLNARGHNVSIQP